MSSAEKVLKLAIPELFTCQKHLIFIQLQHFTQNYGWGDLQPCRLHFTETWSIHVKQPSRLAPNMFAYLCRRRLEEHLSCALGVQLCHTCMISCCIRGALRFRPLKKNTVRSFIFPERRLDLKQPFHVMARMSDLVLGRHARPVEVCNFFSSKLGNDSIFGQVNLCSRNKV